MQFSNDILCLITPVILKHILNDFFHITYQILKFKHLITLIFEIATELKGIS